MSLAGLERELAEGAPRRAYLLAGAETLLRDDALALLRRAVIGDGDPAFLLDRFDGSATPGELADALHTLPVIAKRRMVVLADPEQRRGSARELLEAVADWVGAGGEADTSVLVVTASHPDRRARWVKAFGDAIVACDPPQARARDRGVRARGGRAPTSGARARRGRGARRADRAAAAAPAHGDREARAARGPG